MQFYIVNFMVVLTCILPKSKAFFSDLEKSFDFSKYRGPVPTDKDVWRNVSQLIKSKGYECEEHFVKTDDNFILNIQRIPKGRNKDSFTNAKPKPVIYLQHGLLADSSCWVVNFPETSLGFILADNDFDVWLGNSRGNRYSRRNTKLSPRSCKFWKWSFQEFAKYDLPATIDYILRTTKQRELVYVGHSQGTLIAFAAFSKNTKLAKKIKLFIALAPIVHLGNIKVPLLKGAAELVNVIECGAPPINAPFLPGDIWRKEFIYKGFCNGLEEAKLCVQVEKDLFGGDPTNVNYSRVPVYLSHFPSGTSLKDIIHFAQLVVSGKCQMFDYGIIENYFVYGQARPPLYNVSKIETPIALFSGGDDTLSDPIDVKWLIANLKNLIYNKKLDRYDHFDFVIGLDAYARLYPEIVKLAKKYSSPELLSNRNDNLSL